ncbi:hypothetical protein C2857_005743 [Epichloe festucae Fl1]|uniref:Uncharacterized protein n=1 Tax=Epichloe festucae (strain Fl1) TaxID=877507 RepID=A0A7S9KL66_EPIFF|nr:hypothetical protein C2857_005743 [Epichloe festucae Fl1]
MTEDEIAAHEFVVSVEKFLGDIKTVDFAEAEVSMHDDVGSRVLEVKTYQDDSHPIHNLRWSQVNDKCIKINSYQYSKSVPPRSTKRGALRFIVPTGDGKGVRRDLQATLDRLGRDKNRRRKLNVDSIKLVKETPMDMEWVVLLS